jgi:hypothetical protein
MPTGCEAEQTARVEYAACDLWPTLSKRWPSQQSGNVTCRRSAMVFASEQVATVEDGATPPSAPQFQ